MKRSLKARVKGPLRGINYLYFTHSEMIDFDSLFRLRIVVGRVGEMDNVRWWNTTASSVRSARPCCGVTSRGHIDLRLPGAFSRLHERDAMMFFIRPAR